MALTAPDILKSAAVSFVLRGLTFLTAYLAQKGLRADDVLTLENLALIAGAIVTLGVDIFVTLYRKVQAKNLVQAAREAEPNALMSIIETAAAEKPVVG